ncbi:hypothetical protein ScPMuIL_010040 [Solemya velum]
MTRRLLLISNSTTHGSGYLDHCKEQIKQFLTEKIQTVLFVPYALHDHEGYEATAKKAFVSLGYQLESIHRKTDPVTAVGSAEAIFIGGGNTFRLLNALYDKKLVTEIRRRVLQDGVPYIGSSAGSNVATASIHTTNDMPIVYPPSFTALSLVPFNINPHYIDPSPDSKHMGETREARINQFHEYVSSPPVLGIREGCILLVEDKVAKVVGANGARLFMRDTAPRELATGDDVSFLLKEC